MIKRRLIVMAIVSFLLLASMGSIVSANGGTPGYISESDKLVEITIQEDGSAEKIVIAKEGNWFRTNGGTSVRIPAMKFVYNGVNSVTYSKNGKTITINSTVGDHQDYEVIYPYTTHSIYLPGDDIRVTLDASPNFSNCITYFYLVNASPTELKNAFADMVDGNSQTFRDLLNGSVWSEQEILNFTGDATLNIGTLPPGDYVLVAMFNQTGDRDLHILSATAIEVLDYNSTLDAPSSVSMGDILQATMTIDAPPGSYRFGGVLIHEDAYKATIHFTCEGNKSSTNLTVNGVSLMDSWKIAGVGLSNVNASIAQEKIEGIIGANNGSVVYKPVTANTSQTFSFITSGLNPGNYILCVGVWDSSGNNRLVAFAQKEVTLGIYPTVSNISGTIYYPEYNSTVHQGMEIYVNVYNQSWDPIANTTVSIAGTETQYSVQVPPGIYIVEAYLDLNGNGTYDPSIDPVGYAVNKSDISVADFIDVTSGDNSSADITLSVLGAGPGGGGEGGTGEGGETGQWCYPPGVNDGPVNVTITLYNFTAQPTPFQIILSSFDPITGTGYTYGAPAVQSGGNYTATFTGVWPGTYRVEYEWDPTGFQMPIVVDESLQIPDQQTFSVSYDVSTLPQPRTITVTVKLDETTPMSNAQIMIYNATTWESLGFNVTDENGNATFTILSGREGTYTISVYGSDGSSYSFQVEINDSVSNIVLVVSDLPRIYGYVTKEGTPVGGAFVTVYSDDYSVFVFNITNSNGYYEVRVPSQGEYNMRVEPGMSDVSFPVNETRVSTDSNPNNVSVGVSNAKKIKGYVTNDGTGIAGVYVWAFSEDSFFYAENVTDSNGYYELEVLPGSYTIFFDPTVPVPENNFNPPSQYTPAEESATVENEDVWVNATLSRGTKLYGYVVDEGGTPVTTAQPFLGWVTAYGSSGWYSADVNSNGYYEMYVADGTYTVEFYPYDPSLSTASTTVTVSGDTQCNISVSAGHKLVGRVESNGNAVRSADVVLYNSSTYAFAGWTMTDANGEFEIRGLQNGNYTVEVYSPTAGYYSGDVVISGDTEVTITISGGYTVSGTVIPAGRADVYLYNNMHAFWAETDGSGSFSIAGVPEGTYSVYVYHYDLDIGRSFGPVNVTQDVTGLALDFETDQSSLVNVTGYVKDKSSNSPIQGATVNFISSNFGDSVTTNNTGYYSIQIPAGDYDVIVSADGYSINSTNLSINSTMTFDVLLESISSHANNTVTINITSDYSDDKIVWVTIKSIQSGSSTIDYADVIELTVSPGLNTHQVSLPSGSYKIAVLYPIYSNGMLAGMEETSEEITVPGDDTVSFNIPQ